MAFKLAAVILFVSFFGINAEKKIDVKNCDRSAPIQIKQVYLKSAYPIVIKPGYRISARGIYKNRYLATPESELTLRSISIGRKILWGFVGVPNAVINAIPKRLRCKDLQALSPIPLCPGKQGDNIKFDESITIPKNLKLPGIVSFIGSGTYKVSADVRDQSGRRVVCVNDVVVEVKL